MLHSQTSPSQRPQPWASLSPDERRRRATVAARAHDAEGLVALMEAYLIARNRDGKEVSAHTRRAYATGVRLLVADWREQDLLRPDPGLGAAWLRQLERSGAWSKEGAIGPATPATIRVRLAAGRWLYRALRWAGATEADPFEAVHAARDPVPPWEKRRPYTEDELAVLLAAASEEDRVLLLLGAQAGLRVAEICALRWNDVDRVGAAITVHGGAEGGGWHAPASPELLAALVDLRGPRAMEERIVPLTDSGARKRLRALCARTGIAYRGMHALRHAAGTRLVREGRSQSEAARRLGQASTDAGRIYARWSGTRD